MYIFIDESGNCVKPPAGRRNLACVGALVIPEATLSDLTSRFDRLKQSWGFQETEVKGHALNEVQVAAVIELLVQCRCLFFVAATEMSVNDETALTNYQKKQAEYLTEGLNESAHPKLIKQLTELRTTYEAMQPQLFIQSVLLTDLLKKVIDVATLHFAMTAPQELGAFKWAIDGKDVTKTKYEAAWELIADGLIQGRYLEDSGFMVEEGDYSHFRRFFLQKQEWPPHLPLPRFRNPREPGMILNLSKILKESLIFPDSRVTVGLQLADIATNTFRRAMRGNLQPVGYARIGELMVRVTDDPITLHLFCSSSVPPRIPEYTEPYSIIKTGSRFAGT